MKKVIINLFAVILLSIMTGCEPTGNIVEGVITLNKTVSNINVLKNDTLVATVTPTSDVPLIWVSDDEKIATVFKGIITAQYPGTCNIIVTCGNLSATCVVKVFPSGVDPNDTTTIDDIDEYSLVWSDEFNGAELNRNVWNIEVNGNGGGNNELQYYTARPENVSIGIDPETGESCLILTAKKENYMGKACTSGRVNTKNNLTFKYGLIEARIKIPYTANGLWPAFWMMGNDFDQVGWPKCGEIDIMEMGNANGIRNGTQDRYFNGAAHWGQSWQNHPNYARAITNSYSIQGTFHTFRLYWTPESLTMYLDKDIFPSVQPYYVMEIAASDNTNAPGYYFHKSNFILFNLAIGGHFPFPNLSSDNNINNVTALNAGNNYTASYYIDYVRVYQKGEENETFWQK